MMTDSMPVSHRDDGKKGAFYISQNGQELAVLTYVWSGDKFIIDETWVSEILKGQGAGRRLVASAVDFAREKGVKIMPLCPYARSVFEKTIEYRDVLF
jgi:uncharacterized protein